MISSKLINAQDASVNITSAGVDLGNITHYSFEGVFSSATLNGNFKLQVSNDDVNYIDLAGASDTITSGGSSLINISDAGYRYVRCVWTATSGTGTLTVQFIGKELRFY